MNSGRNSGAASLLAGIGLGAAIMYFLDPRGGAQRRALVRDKSTSALRDAGRSAKGMAQNAANHAKGAAMEMRGDMEGTPSDDQLVARVRAELGHNVERVRSIEVFADRGTVILTGAVPEMDLDQIVSTAQGVRGVERVDNQLTVDRGAGRSASRESRA